MAEIPLAVTKAVLEYTKPPREAERQIAYTAASADIASRLGAVTKKHHVKLVLGGRITLIVGDRGAIWRAHNEQYVADFDALFSLLARYPSQPMRFVCTVGD